MKRWTEKRNHLEDCYCIWQCKQLNTWTMIDLSEFDTKSALHVWDVSESAFVLYIVSLQVLHPLLKVEQWQHNEKYNFMY